jgi:hypothetical protein
MSAEEQQVGTGASGAPEEEVPAGTAESEATGDGAPQPSPPQPPPPQSAAVPDDANDLRGYHFRQLLGTPKTWILIGGAAVVLGVGLAIGTSPIIGLITFGAVVLIGLWVTFMVADSKAADDFFTVYASKRGLTLGGKTRLPAATPLLRKGDDRYAERTLSGPIAPGVVGALVLFTYEEETTDSDGNQRTNYYHYTLGMVEVPECLERLPELYCQRKFGLRSLEKFEDVFRRSKERVKLESEALDEKYEIFCAKGQDENWLRQLFSPTFIVWLCESAPKKFAFELVNGTLVTYVNGHKEDAADLDEIAAAATAVATRLRDESVE